MLGRKRVALVDADGTLLAAAVVPASMQDLDCLEALSAGKGSLAQFARNPARRGVHCRACRGWSNLHGMRHQIVRHEPGQKVFVVLDRSWVVERSFIWLAPWGGLLCDRAGSTDVAAASIACTLTV